MLAQILTVLPAILDKVLPDPNAAAEAKLKLIELAQRGDLAQLTADVDLAKGQMGVNQVEAASTRLFVAGWRPFVGWICGFTIGFKYIGGPLLVMVTQMTGHPVTLPVIDSAELWPVLMGMLGLGGMRTVEKVKGAA